jgi:Zn-dependent protease
LQSIDVAQAIIFIALFVLVSGPVHECAHAYTALRLGDGTAKLFGRVSLDPFIHFDPLGGTLLIASVVLSLVAGGAPFGFGWAKPTPVNPYNLRGRYADARVAAAGPLSNLLLAAVFAVGFRILWQNGVYPDNTSAMNMVQLVFLTGVSLNVLLMLFNLIPVAPLDGSHVLLDLLDARSARRVKEFMDQYGLYLLIGVVLLAGRVIGPFLGPVVNFIVGAQIYQ